MHYADPPRSAPWAQARPRIRRRWVLRALLAVVLLVAGTGGWNAWEYATLDGDYRELLEVRVRESPRDAEAWYALATCSAQGFDHIGECVNPAILANAIRLDPRPLFLETAWPQDRAYFERLVAGDSANALPRLELAELLAREGDQEGSRKAALEALDCPEAERRWPEGFRIHRKFIRAFFGNGYRADSLILRHHRIAWFSPGRVRSSVLEAEAGRLRFEGDLEGAKSLLRFLYGIKKTWPVARDLCEIAVQQGAADADFWRRMAEPLAPGSFGSFCGNVWSSDQPWIEHNACPGRARHLGASLDGAWLPLWYQLHRSEFHSIAEGLEHPDFPAWRRAAKWIAAEKAKEPSPRPLDTLFTNRDLLCRPVRDEATFNRLLALAPTFDAALLTLLRSEWKPPPRPATGNAPEIDYVLFRLGALEFPDENSRKKAATGLARVDSSTWGSDACRVAAQIHREAFLEEACKNLCWSWRPYRLDLLREITGQDFGFDGMKWQLWLQRRSLPSAQPH